MKKEKELSHTFSSDSFVWTITQIPDREYEKETGKFRIGSIEHQEIVRAAREKGELTQWELEAKDVLDNFEVYFEHACKLKQPVILIGIHHACIYGFIDTFMFEGKSMVYAAQHKQADELIKRCLKAIDNKVSSYQRVINTVIANDFLEALFEFREHIQNLIIEAKQIKLTDCTELRNIKSNSLSYKLRVESSTLVTLLNKLINGGFLSSETESEVFSAIFTGQPLNIIEPLNWLRSQALLAYFIDELYQSGKIPRDTDYWSVADVCFVNSKGLKQTKYNYLNNKNSKPKGFEDIDTVLESI